MSADNTERILIVEDFTTIRRIIRNTLRQLGCTNIIEAEDGANALRKLEDHPCDIVITGCDMPKMDGIQLTANIRANPKLSHIPVLMVTAHAEREMILRAVEAGVSDYIIKPFTPLILKDKLNKIRSQKHSAKKMPPPAAPDPSPEGNDQP